MLRKVLFQVHLWCGLVIGLFLAFQGLTGAAVAYRHAGNHWLHAEEMLIEPQNKPFLAISAVLESFSQTFPDIPHNVLSIVFPQKPNEAYFIRVWDNAPSPNMYVSMNSYTGEITGWGSKYEYPFELMFRLHEQVSAGTPGINAVHAGALIMMLMSASGLYLWWPRRETFKQALAIKRRPLRRFLFGLHRVSGAYAFLLLFVVALSGKMIFGLLTLPSIKLDDSGGFGVFAAAGASSDHSGESVPIDSLIEVARERFPNDPIRDLSYIRLARSIVVVTFLDTGNANVRALNRVFFERHTGRVTAIRNSDELVGLALAEDWAFPIHSGEVLGNFGRFIVLLSGLIMPFLFVTGAWLWWKKLALNKTKPAPSPDAV
ncbi:MAG: PepSY-associated TM helix domain-containing protein [Rhodospirillaceae bacterium]